MAQLSRRTLITRTFNGGPGTIAVFAAGSSAVDGLAGLAVDMSQFEGAYFIGSLVHGGTSAAAGNVFSLRASTGTVATLTSGGQGTALLGATATLPTGSSATPESVVIDLYKPRNTTVQGRNVFPQWVCASSCVVIGAGFVLQYGARQAGNSTAAGTIPATTASALGITGGVTAVVSASS